MAWMNDERLHMSPVHKRMQMSVAHVEPGPAVLSTPGIFLLDASACSEPDVGLECGSAVGEEVPGLGFVALADGRART
jgi:hypothetical protein